MCNGVKRSVQGHFNNQRAAARNSCCTTDFFVARTSLTHRTRGKALRYSRPRILNTLTKAGGRAQAIACPDTSGVKGLTLSLHEPGS